MTEPVISLAEQLIAERSISPEDGHCQAILIAQLETAGFRIERCPFDDTQNFLAWHGEKPGQTLMFAGHTDVVPTGDEATWTFPPFTPTQHDGKLYGRGAADMKGALAAMTVAAVQFVKMHPDHNGRLAFLITSDEEASALNGTVKVVEMLAKRNEKIDYCLVGEPSSSEQLGDVIKNGRRGSITAKLTVHGVQGHVAYPHLADNPVHAISGALHELVTTTWDHGNDFFPPTTMQITQITSGSGAENLIPATLFMQFNFRFSSELSGNRIQQRVDNILKKHHLNYSIQWRLSGDPFLTKPGHFTDVITDAIREITGINPALSTSGGTSDGRFIARLGGEVVELGPLNATIHKVDECVSIADLIQLQQIYHDIMYKLLCHK